MWRDTKRMTNRANGQHPFLLLFLLLFLRSLRAFSRPSGGIFLPITCQTSIVLDNNVEEWQPCAHSPLMNKPRMGRPSDYSQDTAAAICARLADGESLRSICRDEAMPDCSTVFRWIGAHEEFRKQYACAREAQADTLADQILEIADDGRNDTYTDEEGRERTDQDVIARSRLRVDARKWLASKMAPKKYGDKVTQEVTGPEGAGLFTGIKVEFVKPDANG